MDPELYRGARDGNWELIKQFENQLSTQVTPEENTVLHIVAQFCDSSFAAEQILSKTPHLLLKSNAQGETSLHIASRKGHSNVFSILIHSAKHFGQEYWPSILRIQNRNGNLALHEAVMYNQPDIVRILFLEDPTLIHISNNARESPLYLAVEKGYHDIASLMFSTFDSSLVSNDFSKNDARGWTPLHYAARINHQEMVRKLLIADRSMAYLTSKSNGGKTALHIAIKHGHIQTMGEILSYCPDCWEMITYDQGKNLLHIAVENEQKEALDFVLEKPWGSNLLNQKDADGNTPLHLYAVMNNSLLDHPEADLYAFNNARQTPQDFVRRSLIKGEPENHGAIQEMHDHESPKEESELKRYETIFNTHMVVDTLILTISFAAAFTVPGGYDDKTGRPQLLRKAAFKAFIICDAISVMFSMVALLSLLLIPASDRMDFPEEPMVFSAYAILALVISFVTGLHASIPIQGLRIFLILLLPLLCGLFIGHAVAIGISDRKNPKDDDNLSTTSKPAGRSIGDKS